MKQATSAADVRLARRLILDELFDLSLYRALRDVAPPDLRRMLDELIPVETRHFAFWQDFFDLRVSRLDAGRRLKLALLVLLCRALGAPAIHLVLEAIEIHGVRKYLHVWQRYRDPPLGGALREVRDTEAARRRFLGEATADEEPREPALGSAILVGVSYFAGALVPVLPVLFGARTAWPSVIVAGVIIILVSMLLAFLSGMNVRRRIVTNVVIIAAAVGITYLIGILTKAVFGIAV